jgi:hypothetical protein
MLQRSQGLWRPRNHSLCIAGTNRRWKDDCGSPIDIGGMQRSRRRLARSGHFDDPLEMTCSRDAPDVRPPSDCARMDRQAVREVLERNVRSGAGGERLERRPVGRIERLERRLGDERRRADGRERDQACAVRGRALPALRHLAGKPRRVRAAGALIPSSGKLQRLAGVLKGRPWPSDSTFWTCGTWTAKDAWTRCWAEIKGHHADRPLEEFLPDWLSKGGERPLEARLAPGRDTRPGSRSRFWSNRDRTPMVPQDGPLHLVRGLNATGWSFVDQTPA